MAITRLKRGMKVDLLSKKKVVFGSWQHKKILSRNQHTYHLYDNYQPSMGVATKRVPRKFIKPLPPLVDGVEIGLKMTL